MKVYIAYGWPEGNWHGKQFSKSLEVAGYQNCNSPEQADIIVAHSAGCYMLPDFLQAQLILLIGIPNWPEKPVVKSVLEKVALEQKNTYWYRKTLFHILYGLSQPLRLIKAYRSFRKKYIPVANETVFVAVHNRQDTYMEDTTNRKLASERGWTYINIEGQHDDLWQNPEPYIEIIKQRVRAV